eukprot:1722238-Pleurochrysis_carterae.AAC.1
MYIIGQPLSYTYTDILGNSGRRHVALWIFHDAQNLHLAMRMYFSWHAAALCLAMMNNETA